MAAARIDRHFASLNQKRGVTLKSLKSDRAQLAQINAEITLMQRKLEASNSRIGHLRKIRDAIVKTRGNVGEGFNGIAKDARNLSMVTTTKESKCFKSYIRANHPGRGIPLVPPLHSSSSAWNDAFSGIERGCVTDRPSTTHNGIPSLRMSGAKSGSVSAKRQINTPRMKTPRT